MLTDSISSFSFWLCFLDFSYLHYLNYHSVVKAINFLCCPTFCSVISLPGRKGPDTSAQWSHTVHSCSSFNYTHPNQDLLHQGKLLVLWNAVLVDISNYSCLLVCLKVILILLCWKFAYNSLVLAPPVCFIPLGCVYSTFMGCGCDYALKYKSWHNSFTALISPVIIIVFLYSFIATSSWICIPTALFLQYMHSHLKIPNACIAQ